MRFWEIQLKVSHLTCVGLTNVLGAYLTRLRVEGMWKDIRFSLVYFVFQLIGWIVGRRTRMDCAKTSDRFYPVKCTHCAIRETDATHTKRWVMWKRRLFKRKFTCNAMHTLHMFRKFCDPCSASAQCWIHISAYEIFWCITSKNLKIHVFTQNTSLSSSFLFNI